MAERFLAGALIGLGRLGEAAEELERARELEPDAPRLADLAAALERARNPRPATVRVHMYRTRTHRMERAPSEIECPPGTQN